MKKKIRKSPGVSRNFSEVLEKFSINPIEGLSYLLPILAMIISFICYLINYIKFIVSGGYSAQKNLVFNEGEIFDESSFEYGLPNIPGYIVIGIWGFALVFIIIHYYREETIFRKVTMSICLGLLLVVGALMIPMVKYDILDKWMFCLAGAALIFVINMFFSGSRNAAINMLVSICLSYIVIPLFFWFLQNIISVCFVILLIIIIVAIFKVISLSGDGSSSGGSNSMEQREAAYKERQREEERKAAIRREEKIQYLKREIKRLEDCISKHYAKEVGYGGIDVAGCERTIAKLRRQLAELGERY